MQVFMNHSVRLVAGILILSAIAFLPGPSLPARAQTPDGIGEGFGPGGAAEIPYGGLHVFTVDCDCSANLLLFFFDYATKMPLDLVYEPGISILYSYYNPYGTYLLGRYIPSFGLASLYNPTSLIGQCWVPSGSGCAEVFSNGMLGFLPGSGTSGL